MHDGRAGVVEDDALVVVDFVGRLRNPEGPRRGKRLFIIQLRFVEGILKWFVENLGCIFLVRRVVVSESVQDMHAHEAARAL